MSKDFHIAIIGAGLSGIQLGDAFGSQGYRYTVFEKASQVGGTWRDNTYPGLFIDVLTRNYEYKHARGSGWKRRFAAGSEIQDYLVDFARKKGVVKNTKFGVEIVSTEWVNGKWELKDISGRKYHADAVVAATGFLRVPTVPNFEGKGTFRGPAFHSSEWDHSVNMQGKRIGVIGTGSSGVQIVSEMGKRGNEVTHFIRTPQWMMVRENPEISVWEKLLLKIPGTGKYVDRYKAKLFAKIEGPPSWRFEPGPERIRVQEQYRRELERLIPDPVLREKLTPKDEPGSKRIAKTQDYYKVVQRSNVHVSVGGIQRIEADGIVDAEGVKHELDVIVYATGFDAHAYMRPMQITGPDGITMDDVWKDGVFSYYGVGVPGMPNLFLACGPYAPINLVPIPSLVEDELQLINRLLALSSREGVALAPTMEATNRFLDEIQAAIPRTTFAKGPNWYTDKTGRQIIWPWNRDEHALRLKNASLDDFARFPTHKNWAGAPAIHPAPARGEPGMPGTVTAQG